VTIQNRLPLALSYDSNNTPSGLAEFQISSIDLADVATDHAPEQYQVLAWSAVGDGTFLYAPSTIVTGGGGGGGGVSFPNGNTGDILYYHTDGTSVTSISPTATPINLATTGYVEGKGYLQPTDVTGPTGYLQGYIPNDTTANVTGPLTFVSNQPLFPVGYNATGPISVTGPLNVTGPSTHEGPFTFDRKPLVDTNEVVISTDLDAYVTEAEFDGSAGNFFVTSTGGNGDLILKDSTNTTTTQPPAAFIAANSILIEPTATTGPGDVLVKQSDGTLEGKDPSELPFSTGLNVTGPAVFTGVASFTEKPTVDGTAIVINSDLAAYVTEVEYDASADLFVTKTGFDGSAGDFVTEAEFDGSAGDFVTNVEYDASADLFVATSITTTNSRTFLGTDADLGDLTDVNVGSPTEGEALVYRGGGTWQAGTLSMAVGDQTVPQNLLGNFVVSNVLSTPPGTTGKGDTVVNKLVAFSGTDSSSTQYVGSEFGVNWIQQPDQAITAGDNFIYFSSSDAAAGPVALPLNSNARSFMESGSATNISAANLNVTRTGQMNPTVYIQEADWLTPGGAANGFGTTQSGSNAGFGQCFDNDVMHPDKGTIGVYEVRSGTDGYGRAFLTTFNNALAVSSCAISFTSRIAPSGLWLDGSNEGKMCFGFRNGTGNSAATYAMEFQYGQGGGETTTNWSAVVTDNSNSTVSDTGIAVSAQEFQVLQVSCNENWQNVDFYVDGVLKAQFNIDDHHIPDSRFNRLGLAWAINNANIYSTANTTVGNEIFVDWHQIRMTHNNTTRGKDLIQ